MKKLLGKYNKLKKESEKQEDIADKMIKGEKTKADPKVCEFCKAKRGVSLATRAPESESEYEAESTTPGPAATAVGSPRPGAAILKPRIKTPEQRKRQQEEQAKAAQSGEVKIPELAPPLKAVQNNEYPAPELRGPTP